VDKKATISGSSSAILFVLFETMRHVRRHTRSGNGLEPLARRMGRQKAKEK